MTSLYLILPMIGMGFLIILSGPLAYLTIYLFMPEAKRFRTSDQRSSAISRILNQLYQANEKEHATKKRATPKWCKTLISAVLLGGLGWLMQYQASIVITLILLASILVFKDVILILCTWSEVRRQLREALVEANVRVCVSCGLDARNLIPSNCPNCNSLIAATAPIDGLRVDTPEETITAKATNFGRYLVGAVMILLFIAFPLMIPMVIVGFLHPTVGPNFTGMSVPGKTTIHVTTKDKYGFYAPTECDVILPFGEDSEANENAISLTLIDQSTGNPIEIHKTKGKKAAGRWDVDETEIRRIGTASLTPGSYLLESEGSGPATSIYYRPRKLLNRIAIIFVLGSGLVAFPILMKLKTWWKGLMHLVGFFSPKSTASPLDMQSDEHAQ